MKILALYTKKGHGYDTLPDTTNFLNEKQIVPVIGDSIAVLGNDYLLLGNTATDSNNVRKVNKRYINFNGYDVAVLLDEISY